MLFDESFAEQRIPVIGLIDPARNSKLSGLKYVGSLADVELNAVRFDPR